MEPTDTDESEELATFAEGGAKAAVMAPGEVTVVVVELEKTEAGRLPTAICVYVSPGSGMPLALGPEVASCHLYTYHEAV
jgi:hypothetical protein